MDQNVWDVIRQFEEWKKTNCPLIPDEPGIFNRRVGSLSMEEVNSLKRIIFDHDEAWRAYDEANRKYICSYENKIIEIRLMIENNLGTIDNPKRDALWEAVMNLGNRDIREAYNFYWKLYELIL